MQFLNLFVQAWAKIDISDAESHNAPPFLASMPAQISQPIDRNNVIVCVALMQNMRAVPTW